ncbi:hypothetical protein [Bradyrhizobium liaoningense]
MRGQLFLPTSERPFNPSRQTAVLLASAERIGPQTRCAFRGIVSADFRGS